MQRGQKPRAVLSQVLLNTGKETQRTGAQGGEKKKGEEDSGRIPLRQILGTRQALMPTETRGSLQLEGYKT